MERVLLRSTLSTIFLFFLCHFSSAQDLTGIWKGYFITNDGVQYRLEFQVKQNNSSSITGVSYSYLDVQFYGKATMSGSLNRSEKQFQIQELRTVEVKNMSGGGTCLMKYIFTYDRSGKEEFLEGTFVGKSEDRKNPKNDGNWGDCGGGKVYLRRVQSSDFYVEPFLRDNPKPNTVDTKLKSPPPLLKKTPLKTSLVVKTNHPVKNNSTTIKNKPVVEKKPVIIKPSTISDSVKETRIDPVIKNPVSDKKIFTPEILKTRENALAKTIIVNTEEVSIRLYDNGEIDGDSISVFVDKKLVLSHKGLSTVPINLSLKFDDNNDEHEVIMVAENLGRIPPNTSLMIIDAGDKRYKVQITSTEQKNALVRFKYEKPSQ
ncbi:MAG: hypothetical protein ACHQF0_10340 [Chitinophagales bacterium]